MKLSFEMEFNGRGVEKVLVVALLVILSYNILDMLI